MDVTNTKSVSPNRSVIEWLANKSIRMFWWECLLDKQPVRMRPVNGQMNFAIKGNYIFQIKKNSISLRVLLCLSISFPALSEFPYFTQIGVYVQYKP